MNKVTRVISSIVGILIIISAFTACEKSVTKESVYEPTNESTSQGYTEESSVYVSGDEQEATDEIINENESQSNAYVIDIDNVNGIGAEAAEALCYNVFPNEDDETGFPISYRCIGAVKYNDKDYYVTFNSWLVQDTHWSYIGNYFVASDGSEICDGIFDENNNIYIVTSKIWNKLEG